MREDRLYIKVILQNQAKEQKRPPGGSKTRPFKEVTSEIRSNFISKVSKINDQFDDLPQSINTIPARVILDEKALAKSHTPLSLFNDKTWSIIGKGEAKELFVKVTKEGTKELIRKFETGFSRDTEKAISTIENIEPIDSDIRLSGISPQDLLIIAPKRNEKSLIKVKLFTFNDDKEQEINNSSFEQMLVDNEISFKKLEVYETQQIYQLDCKNSEEIAKISNAVMVRNITPMPVVRVLREHNFNDQPIPKTLPSPDNAISYPTVGVVDTGINQKISILQPWIYARESEVAQNEQNPYHGTFVAGLIVWGNQLNPALKELDNSQCKVLDIQILPNSDPSYGSIGILTEEELIQSLDEVLLKYSNDVKVWNLSLGTDEVCDLKKFSDFAIQLDELQEKYSVSFVIAAGNCQIDSLLSYPRKKNELHTGRIAAPADSVLGITVGSISQIDNPISGTRFGEPSPFSRNGPGPNHIIKPDFVHHGGSICMDGSSPIGVTSISSETTIGDDIGTSFATPLISRKLAHIYNQITPTPSPIMARALLTHSARDLRSMGRIPEDDNLYLGFGTPTNIDLSLRCEPWHTTLVFEESLREGFELEWDNFPYPESLINSNGTFRGEILMTLAYHPKRNPDFGSEYCETHVNASFGVVNDDYDGDKNEIKEKFNGQVPQEHLRSSKLFEVFQVEKLRKWSPVRTHHKILQAITGKRWKLKVNMITRHGFINDSDETQKNLFPALYIQNFALVLTIADPLREAPIYDEMARILRNRFQSRNLQLRPSIQVRT